MVRRLLGCASRILGLMLVVSAMGQIALGQIGINNVRIPELDPVSASSAIALLAGAALVARDKFRL